jgi:hypothetical protein
LAPAQVNASETRYEARIVGQKPAGPRSKQRKAWGKKVLSSLLLAGAPASAIAGAKTFPPTGQAQLTQSEF